ncbi:O-methyltransferase, family 3 [Alkaliphilus metalliredigens QYMF]|uniref:tRNA 5-hydroxyuridine methyltransferase n=1 Tax=Alkaliphilus metalliredigens (strain QYMF) TaxID=293826 RepID=A6TR06_ALKMQ|nr:O-methyltransferase [Alkaliphilus metalliredigens]ABR48624.1 O-methyltransferase, family 3 [Alkaliphilus metalliredigens QYMF]
MSQITTSHVEDYIHQLLPEHSGLLKELEIYAEEHSVPIVHKEVAAFLKVTIKATKAQRILEVGTAIAYSAILFCHAMGEDGQVTTIERNEKMIEQANRNIIRSGLEKNIRIIQDDAQEALKFLDGQYDIIFLDGAKGQYKEFFNDCIRLLKVGGILISDNILFHGMIANDELVQRSKRTIVNRMRDYLQYICHHEQLETSIIPIGDGVTISYKKK